MLYYFVLLLPASLSLFWVVMLLCRWKTNYRAQKIWMGTAVLAGLSTFIWSVYFAGVEDYSLFYKLDIVEGFSTMLLLPMFYFCFRSLTNEKPFGWKELLWLLPSLIVGGSMALLYRLMGEEQSVVYIREVIRNGGQLVTLTDPAARMLNIISVRIYNYMVLLQIALVLVYATYRLLRYRHTLKEFFSNFDGKSIGNSTALLIGLYVTLLLALITYKGRFFYNNYPVIVMILMTLWAAVIFYIGYNVYTLNYTAEGLADDLEKADREATAQGYVSPDPANDTATKGKYREMGERFARLLDEDRIYLKSDLRLDEVARMMRTNRTYISRMINEEYGKPFSDVINLRRIEHAQELMRTEGALTQEQIAERSGFSHASSFSRTFKQHAGMTFREWQNSLRPTPTA